MASKKFKKNIINTSKQGIGEFIEFVKGCNISSLSVKEGNSAITVYQNKNSLTAQAEPRKVVESQENEQESLAAPKKQQLLSTFIGVYQPVKGIKPGVVVKLGELLANIYSMNMAQQIKATQDGTIEEILVNKNDLIDYGKPLFIIN